MQWRMLQQEEPDDFVIATGKQFSVREFVTVAAAELGMKLYWEGEGVDEIGIVESVNCIDDDLLTTDLVGKTIVKVDPRYFRPTEVDTLLGDPAKAKAKLGWEPTTTFEQLVTEMVAFDLDKAKRFALLKRRGFDVALTEE